MRPSRATVLRALSATVAFSLVNDGARGAEIPARVLTPDIALQRLSSGNARYREEAAINCNRHYHRRGEIAAAQAPFAVVLGCADSRVPPEVIFDQRLGDLFVVRLAGNVADDNALGSIEYAVEHFHPALVMVLGHEKCGAVAATLDAVAKGVTVPGYIGTIVEAIEPAVKRAKHERGDALHAAVRANVVAVAERIRSVSTIVREAERAGTLHVVGATYDLASGSVAVL